MYPRYILVNIAKQIYYICRSPCCGALPVNSLGASTFTVRVPVALTPLSVPVILQFRRQCSAKRHSIHRNNSSFELLKLKYTGVQIIVSFTELTGNIAVVPFTEKFVQQFGYCLRSKWRIGASDYASKVFIFLSSNHIVYAHSSLLLQNEKPVYSCKFGWVGIGIIYFTQPVVKATFYNLFGLYIPELALLPRPLTLSVAALLAWHKAYRIRCSHLLQHPVSLPPSLMQA